MSKTKAEEFVSAVNAVLDIVTRQINHKHGHFVANMMMHSLFEERKPRHDTCHIEGKSPTYLWIEFDDKSIVYFEEISADGFRTYVYENPIFK